MGYQMYVKLTMVLYTFDAFMSPTKRLQCYQALKAWYTSYSFDLMQHMRTSDYSIRTVADAPYSASQINNLKAIGYITQHQ